MPPRMTTRSAGRATVTPRGGRTSGRTGRGGGRTRGRSGDLGNGGIDGQGGQVGGQGTEVNDGVHGVPDFSTIIAQQMQNLLSTILAQVGDQDSNIGYGRNQNGDAVNDNIRGDVRNVIENNNHRSYTYKDFLACNPKIMMIAGTLTDEAIRNGSIKKNLKKRGNVGEPSKDKSGKDENKRTRTGNAFATTTNPVRRENTGNARNPAAARGACFECGGTDRYKSACPRHVGGYLCWSRGGSPGPEHRDGYEIEIANEQLVEIDKVIKGCKLEIDGHVFDINLIPLESGSFDVIIGIDWLSNHKAEILCHEKVVRIPLLDGKVPRVLGERPNEKARHLMSAKAKEQKQEEMAMVRDFPEEEHEVHLGKIEAVKNWEAPRTSLEVHSFLGLAGYYRWFIENFSKIAKSLTILTQERIKKDIAVDESIAIDFVTKLPKTSSGHDTVWVIVDRLTKSAHFLPIRKDYKMDRLARFYLNAIVARHGVPISIISDRDSHFTLRFCQTMQEALGTKLDMSTAYHPQTDGQKGKLAPRFVVPFEISDRIGLVAYRLRLPEELNGVHDTFYVSNLKKCLADPTLQVPLDEIQVDAKLNFVEEPVKILEREFKKLKRSRIAIVRFGGIQNVELNSRESVKIK
uniref:Putative retrotransposon protein n=1 Tax=Tanacetum cinerariifolium TaxID=118510 RepID=A0A6L2LDT3_TANCI|nr:putative retrotransposon protein [Tanacetum cinerariifolium]